MFSYVFMKILEGRPASYDRRIDAVSRGRVAAMKRDVAVRVAPHSHVLEIGCGTGELASLLIKRGCRVEGFDQSRGMIKVARKRIVREGLKDELSVRHMGVDGMDRLPSRTYDAVVSTLVFSELSDGERRFALKHAARVLTPGGHLIVADEVVPRTSARRILHSLSRAPALALTYLATGAKTEPIADLAAEIRAAGFVIDDEVRSHGDAFTLISAHHVEEDLAA